MSSSMRGSALLVLAVIAGVAGLQIIDDSGGATPSGSATTTTTTVSGVTSSTVAGQGTTTTTRAGATSSTTGSTSTTRRSGTASTTSTTKAARAANEIMVLVSNGSGLQGAATNTSTKLKGFGYNTSPGVTNATERTGTAVQCKSGYEAEAAKLAVDVGGTAKVEAYPASPPTEAANANCIVVLGK